MLAALRRWWSRTVGRCEYCDKPLNAQELQLTHLLTVCLACYKKFRSH